MSPQTIQQVGIPPINNMVQPIIIARQNLLMQQQSNDDPRLLSTNIAYITT